MTVRPPKAETCHGYDRARPEPGVQGVAQVDIMMSTIWHHDVQATITLDEDVASNIRTEMRRSGRSFKEIVNEFLRLGLNIRRQVKSPHPFVVKPSPMGSRPGLNYDNVGELLEQLEGPTHR